MIENVSIATGVKLNAASQLGGYLESLYRNNPDIAPTQSNHVLNRVLPFVMAWVDLLVGKDYSVE